MTPRGKPTSAGIHHVTAVAADAQGNLDFYAGFLGLRLVKKTVNFDDPGSYHLYYGDELGRPGTVLTFFPWQGARPGRRGNEQVALVSLAVPRRSLGFWLERLAARNLPFEGPKPRFGEPTVGFADPDGLALELVGSDVASDGWAGGPVPAADAVRGVHGVTLWAEDHEATAGILTGFLGFEPLAEEGDTLRYRAAGEGPGRLVDIRRAPGFWPGASGAGTVHHIAFRTPTDEAQRALRDRAAEAGLAPTPVLDRQYFRSVYFREPGGVLFEVATDGPGFTVDEPAEGLGGALKLPPQFESMRGRLEATLPSLYPLERPGALASAGERLDFVHRWEPGLTERTLLLLHGTGGSESDLLPLGRMLAPEAARLSPRGKVLENGKPRFFRRLAEGVFDEEDLRRRAGELASFVWDAAQTYGFNPASVVAVGYSNGANIASATLLLHPGVIRAAVLLRPMVPLEPEALPDLAGVPVLLSAGTRDPLIPGDEVLRLEALLKRAGAEVTLRWQEAGHELSDEELREAGEWLAEQGAA